MTASDMLSRARAYDQSVYCPHNPTADPLAGALLHLPSGTYQLGLCDHPVHGAALSDATRVMPNLRSSLHAFSALRDPGFTYTTVSVGHCAEHSHRGADHGQQPQDGHLRCYRIGTHGVTL